MATKEKILKDIVRDKNLAIIKDFLVEQGEDVLDIATNKFVYPTVDSEGNEMFVQVTVSIPSGQRGMGGYDGYADHQAYEVEKQEKLEKEKAKALAKARKQAKDEELRQKKKADGAQ